MNKALCFPTVSAGGLAFALALGLCLPAQASEIVKPVMASTKTRVRPTVRQAWEKFRNIFRTKQARAEIAFLNTLKEAPETIRAVKITPEYVPPTGLSAWLPSSGRSASVSANGAAVHITRYGGEKSTHEVRTEGGTRQLKEFIQQGGELFADLERRTKFRSQSSSDGWGTGLDAASPLDKLYHAVQQNLDPHSAHVSLD